MAENRECIPLLKSIDLGASVAELDDLLSEARVETSAFTDLLNDRVDLIPGTKGSGKSALFRIFVDFLPKALFDQKRVVIAHGVQKQGDQVFHAYKEKFEKLNEDEFTCFWFIYLVSLLNEHFVKGELYKDSLNKVPKELEAFKAACETARIPEIRAKKSLSEILGWGLEVLKVWRPKIAYKFGGDQAFELDLFGSPVPIGSSDRQEVDQFSHIKNVQQALEQLLVAMDLNVWLMIDRLDEVFPRRSAVEATALRGLLRVLRIFTSETIRVKIFLRDDMLEHILSEGQGFTALTHITARKADTLCWAEEGILTLIVKRLFHSEYLREHFDIDPEKLEASSSYRRDAFYKVFPKHVHSPPNQSETHSWIYSHTKDGRGVVTPRDVIDLLTRAIQWQQDDFQSNPDGTTEHLISSRAIRYGLEELSKRKRETYLQAEFPHLWGHIEKFVGGKTEHDSTSMNNILGKNWKSIAEDLISIGLIQRTSYKDKTTYWFPFVYRKGLELTQGKA